MSIRDFVLSKPTWPRLRQPRELNAVYARLRRPAVAVMWRMYALFGPFLGLIVVLKLVARAHAGEPIAGWQWLLGGLSGFLMVAAGHGVLLLEGRGPRYMDLRGQGRWLDFGPVGFRVARERVLKLVITPESAVPSCWWVTVCCQGPLGSRRRKRRQGLLVKDLAEARKFAALLGAPLEERAEMVDI